jgi:(4S)-4-hydroxy-5-phosphonooxypentane-2,3-dione isomerase
MLIHQVFVHIKPEFVDAFLEATKENSRNSVQESGCVQFDVLQQKDDPTRFVLHEVYQSVIDLDTHRTMPHFFTWRDTVSEMLAEPRYSIQFENAFPPDADFLRRAEP